MSRKFLAPEVVQTSAMDCGPAALKCLLDGHGVPVSYGRLREACQTDVDGTSIDTLEEVGKSLGLDAEQIILPEEHLLTPEAGALPALVVTVLPNGFTHFVVVWRTFGRWVQVMDPGSGRRWVRAEDFMRDVFLHQTEVGAEEWREWAAGDEATATFRGRMKRLGLQEGADELLSEAQKDPTWTGLGTLDASIRMVAALVESGGIKHGAEAEGLLRAIYAQARRNPKAIPKSYWSAIPAGEGELAIRCVVLARVKGRLKKDPEAAAATDLPADLAAALSEPDQRPWRDLWRLLAEDGLLTFTTLIGSLVLAVSANVLLALLFRSLIDLGGSLGLVHQRLTALLMLLVFVGVVMLLEIPVVGEIRRLGRRLENRLRVAFLRKLPRLTDRYLSSRPVSDMASRSHAVYRLRRLPDTGSRIVRTTMELGVTTAAIAWVDPWSAPAALLVALASVVLPTLVQKPLQERDLRVRTLDGSLSRFYLDALIGLVAIRTHGAERAVQTEHENLLVEWSRAGREHLRASMVVEAAQGLLGFGLAIGLLATYLSRVGDGGGALVLLYWALRLPALGEELAVAARQYPSHRNVAMRLLEPLGAVEDQAEEPILPRLPKKAPTVQDVAEFLGGAEESTGVAVSLKNVSVVAGGHPILKNVTLDLKPGSHVAIVGPSGAGKSSLVGLLLGWHRAASGVVYVDGHALGGTKLRELRQETAWVDPSVHLWNRALLDNLLYGNGDPESLNMGEVLDAANLRGVLEDLPEGLQTALGEGGGLVSGGEGQRVRFGRALLRRECRLVILDEPFRGLEKVQRRELLARARRRWRDATLVCITHDVSETRSFGRVLVIEDGRLVEDGKPDVLADRADSRYRSLLAAEKHLWAGNDWRRVSMLDGRVVDQGRAAAA